MRLISDKPLREFCEQHPEAERPIGEWRGVVLKGDFPNFAALKMAFNATDKVGAFCVFDIGGNKYRIIASVHFNVQKLFVRHVLTHKEYDTWKP